MESKIVALLEEKFNEEGFKDCFVIEVKIEQGNKIEVYVDSDSWITFDKCRQLSRFLEQHFDDEQWFGQKYTLEVSSPGIDRPLMFVRQYHKNIGRRVSVTTINGEQQEGVLQTVSDEGILLEQKVRVKEGKKKVTQIQQTPISFGEIKKTIVKTKF